DPNHEFCDDDLPGPRRFSYPIITLGFVGDRTSTVDAGVLDAAEAFERALVGPLASTRAGRGEVVLQVSWVPSEDGVGRKEQLVVLGDGHRPSGDWQELQRRAIDELRSAVRFVLISSGESIESVLEGNFREILHSVVRERLK